MRLVDGVGKFVAELIEDGLDPGIVLLGDQLADDALQPVIAGEAQLEFSSSSWCRIVVAVWGPGM